jgi:hypothetical protein
VRVIPDSGGESRRILLLRDTYLTHRPTESALFCKVNVRCGKKIVIPAE